MLRTLTFLDVETGMRDELMPIIEQKFGASNRSRVIKSVRSLQALAASSFGRDSGAAIILSIVISLLPGLTALVIIRLSSLDATQRTNQSRMRRLLA